MGGRMEIVGEAKDGMSQKRSAMDSGIRRWLHRRHPNKGQLWLKKKYFRPHRTIRWSFFAVKNQSDGKKEYRDLIKAGWTHIVRHVKVQGEANPYDPNWDEYFLNRKRKKIYSNKDGRFVEELGWLHDE